MRVTCMRMRACVHVMRVRAYNTSGGESQENFDEKIFKIPVDSVCEIVYHVIVR